MALIQVKNFSYGYPGALTNAISNISFDIRNPYKISVIGGNSSGKTTLANALFLTYFNQLEGKVSGAIEFQFDKERSAQIGLLFEDINWMFCSIHVEEEVAFALENLCVPPSEIRRRVDDILQLVGLDGFQKRQINTLSGGEMQKLAIASVLVSNPSVIITDDLLSNIDIESASFLPKLIDEYRREMGCIWIDFSRRWAEYCNSSDDIAILKAGELLYSAPPRHLYDNFGSRLIADGNFYLPESFEMLTKANQLLHGHNLPLIPPHMDRSQIDTEIKKHFWVKSCQVNQSESEIIPKLELNKISFEYQKDLPVLSECSIIFGAGLVNMLAGRNGSGKSTLAKICAGLLKEKKGQIYLHGRRLSDSDKRAKACLVFQNPEYHFLSDTVYDELYLTGRLLSLDAKENKRQVDEIMALLGLDDKANSNPYFLNSGEKRRLAIGIGLARKAEILIVDEPTLGQDKRQSNMLGRIFRTLADSGTTLIIVSHDSRFIFQYGDLIHFLNQRKVVFSGSIPAFYRSSWGSEYYQESDILKVWDGIQGASSLLKVPRSVEEFFGYTEIRQHSYD